VITATKCKHLIKFATRPTSVRKSWKSTFLITPLLFNALSLWNPWKYPHKLYIARTYRAMGCIFIADSMGLSSFKFLYALLKRNPRLCPLILVILVSTRIFRPTFEPIAVISNIQRAKVPRSESSRERKFQGAEVPGNESSMELLFLGAKVPGNESSRQRKFHPMELSFPGAKVLRNESSCYQMSLLMTNRNLHMRFRLVPRLMTLDDLELL